MTPDSRYVRVNGLNLHYWDWGGSGPPLVFVHATGLHGRVWDPLARALRDRFHVLSLDQRGHGDSEKPPTGYHWANFVHDLKGFLDACAIAMPVGIGHSAGGAAIAHCEALFPGTFRAAVLCEPVISPPRAAAPPAGSQNTMADGTRRRRIVWPDRQAIFDSYHSRPPFGAWREDVLWDYINHGTRDLPDGQVALKCPAEIEAQIYEHSASLDTFQRLADIKVPALVIRGGTASRYQGLQESAQLVADRLPQGRLVTIEGAGHFIPQERPDDVLAAILAFLAER